MTKKKEREQNTSIYYESDTKSKNEILSSKVNPLGVRGPLDHLYVHGPGVCVSTTNSPEHHPDLLDVKIVRGFVMTTTIWSLV